MTHILEIHRTHPQNRLIYRVAEVLRGGGVVVYPTDSGYAIGCHLGEKSPMERIRKIRGLTPRHNFTLMCRDLSEISVYARVDNPTFRLLKAHTPGPYTFILEATKEVPKRVLQLKRKTIGIRVPDDAIVRDLITQLGQPMLTTSLILPGQAYPFSEAYEIYDALDGQVDMIVDAGPIPQESTSVIDLTNSVPQVLREGSGDITAFS